MKTQPNFKENFIEHEGKEDIKEFFKMFSEQDKKEYVVTSFMNENFTKEFYEIDPQGRYKLIQNNLESFIRILHKKIELFNRKSKLYYIENNINFSESSNTRLYFEIVIRKKGDQDFIEYRSFEFMLHSGILGNNKVFRDLVKHFTYFLNKEE